MITAMRNSLRIFFMPIYPDRYCEKCKKKLRILDDEQMKNHMESVHRIFECDKCAFKGEIRTWKKCPFEEMS